jgi:hypothetical protein
MKRLVARWVDGCDFRRHEDALNALPRFVADTNGTEIQSVHMRARLRSTTRRLRSRHDRRLPRDLRDLAMRLRALAER